MEKRTKYIIQTRISPSHPWEDEPNGGYLPTLAEAKRVARAWLGLELKYAGNIRIIETGGSKHVVWSGEAIKGASTATKTTTMRTFKNVPVRVLLDAFGGTDQSDCDENTNLLDFTGVAASGFIKEWIEHEFDRNEVNQDEIEDVIRDSVQQKIDENVSRSMFVKVMRSAEDALSSSLEEAKVPHDITIDERKGTLTISVEADAIVRAWAEQTKGIGYVAWDPTLTAKDITNVTSLVSILDGRAEVYGYSPMKRSYNDNFYRFEPDTGTYYDLDKIAVDAWKKHLREKHKANTKHRR